MMLSGPGNMHIATPTGSYTIYTSRQRCRPALDKIDSCILRGTRCLAEVSSTFPLTKQMGVSTRVDTTSRCPSKISAAEAYFPTSRIALRAAKGGKLAICRVLVPERVTRIMSGGLLLEVDRLRSWSCTTSSLNVNKRERYQASGTIVRLTASPIGGSCLTNGSACS